MDEKKFEELLLKNNQNLIKEIDSKMEKRFKEIDKKFEHIDKNFKKIDKRFEQVDKRFEQVDKRFEQVDKRFEQVDKKFDEAETKRIDDNFYLEHTYGEKISIIFDKIQLIDDLKTINDKENQQYKDKVEHNSAILMSHDFRISKLEKKLNSKNV